MLQQQQAQMSALVGEVPPGPALVYMPAPIKPRTYDRYKHKQSIKLGIAQIIIGILCVIFNSVALGVPHTSDNRLFSVGQGYWCGVLVSKLTDNSFI